MEPIKIPKPEWLRVKGGTAQSDQVTHMLRTLGLHTVCEEAQCPNRGECFNKRTATFMLLGSHCTRNCTFCTVTKANPCAPDPKEPEMVARAVAELGLRHVVVTSVTRDDLPDGGAAHFAQTIKAIRGLHLHSGAPIIEVLIPDFQGSRQALEQVINAAPDILNHNVETVPRLYKEVRPMAVYARSLELLRRVLEGAPGIYTKSGIMVGLGETHEEVLAVMRDLRAAGCRLLTVGQYLAPSKAHHPVMEYITPEEFAQYKREAEALGFLGVASAPLVRSSYMAEESFRAVADNKEAT